MRRHASLLVGTAVLASACMGTIGDGGGGAPSATAGPNGPAGDPGIASACSATYAPGHVPVHRLTNTEYDNTVRDLLFTKTRPGQGFEPTAPGLSGFRNDSDALKISDTQVNAYYDAAEALAKEVVASKGTPGGAYAKLVACAPSADCAKTALSAFAARAYRRPVTPDEVNALLAVFQQAPDFDTGLQDALISILVSPKFIFVTATSDTSNVAGAEFALDPYQLAARLSYALWQTTPDDELTARAADGTLTRPEVLAAQVRRMIGDPRISDFLVSMRNDWAGLESLADPAGSLVGLDDALRASMVGEVDAFFRDLVARDRSVLDVVTRTTSFADGRLAAYYGASGVDPGATSFAEVPLPAQRRGLVTSAGILTATAGATTYTHPVKRGKWVVHQITCQPPPQPSKVPPVVNFDPASGATPRETLQSHVGPACAGCHKEMDTFGLALENFDPFGKWRDTYTNLPGPIDASGSLDDGKSFTTPAEMFDDLAQDPQTRACLAQQVMGYMLTRALTSPDDGCVTSAIGAAAVTPTSTFTELVTKIVESRQFLMQTGEAP